MGRRLTRKEIVQEDPIQKFLTEASEWVLRHTSLILVGLGLVVALLAGGYFWQQYQASRDAELQQKFATALEIYHAPVGDEVEALQEGHEEHDHPPIQAEYHFETPQERYQRAREQFQAMVDESPNSRLGLYARYYLGLTYQQLGQSQAAEPHLRFVVENAPLPEIRNLARNALATVKLSQNDLETSIRLLNQILEEPSPNFPRQIVLMRLAELYEKQGDTAEALKRYRQITTEFATTEMARQAQTKVEQLEDLVEEKTQEADSGTEG